MLKFKELLDKERQERKREEIKKEIFIKDLRSRVDDLLDLNKTYGPVEAYALTFAKFLKDEFMAHDTDVLWFQWGEMQRYLTDICMEIGPKGVTQLKRLFKKHLLNRGYSTRISRKYDTFRVGKIKPRKSTR